MPAATQATALIMCRRPASGWSGSPGKNLTCMLRPLTMVAITYGRVLTLARSVNRGDRSDPLGVPAWRLRGSGILVMMLACDEHARSRGGCVPDASPWAWGGSSGMLPSAWNARRWSPEASLPRPARRAPRCSRIHAAPAGTISSSTLAGHVSPSRASFGIAVRIPYLTTQGPDDRRHRPESDLRDIDGLVPSRRRGAGGRGSVHATVAGPSPHCRARDASCFSPRRPEARMHPSSPARRQELCPGAPEFLPT